MASKENSKRHQQLSRLAHSQLVVFVLLGSSVTQSFRGRSNRQLHLFPPLFKVKSVFNDQLDLWCLVIVQRVPVLKFPSELPLGHQPNLSPGFRLSLFSSTVCYSMEFFFSS